MTPTNLISIYDFEIFPYALGDVLTWNIHTAMRCAETGCPRTDIYICLDAEHHASIYQRGLINRDNYELFFSELYSAFGTNQKLGNIFIFRDRKAMIAELMKTAPKHPANKEAFHDYLNIIKSKASDKIFNKVWTFAKALLDRSNFLTRVYRKFIPKRVTQIAHQVLSKEQALNQYFIKYIYSHDHINQFYKQNGYIPYLQPSLGCNPDVLEIIAREFKYKKIVAIHLRLRRLDLGYGGEHTYTRDSDFLEWYHFLRTAGQKYPNVQFITLGRLQEKPLEILRLPNVTSLRIHGMGLGHELTLMLKSDLFIGTSSGFAALANFSALPYFVTRMNPESCKAYAIQQGEKKLPFANANQHLIYEEETSELLMQLLERGLNLSHDTCYSNPSCNLTSSSINTDEWLSKHTKAEHPARTTSRFYTDDDYRIHETVYLLLANIEKVKHAIDNNEHTLAQLILHKINDNFPDLGEKYKDYMLLQNKLKNRTEEIA
jgi:hypothetical protein